jgi:LmbE family N-acetylglucosaminyl deacetylase
MKYLLVVAHPDDEVLGAGASIFKWTRRGDVVDVAIMCSEANARAFRPDDAELNQDIVDSLKFLGINKKYDANFPNIEMNTIPHIKLVQFIESAIKMSSPDIIITHHPADTNNDHLHTSMACQEAIRLFQRRPEINRIKEFWFMEVPSCTEWAVNNSINLFRPNCFVEVGEDAIEAKIKALGMYRGVMRPYPHPRSAEYIKGLAAVRGSQWGQVYSESFEVSIRAE